MANSTYPDLTDEQLLEVIQHDDPKAFEVLYDRYWYKLYECAYRRMQCKEDTEEAVQNLFESLWKNRGRIQIRTSLQVYLFSAMKYIVLRMVYNKTSATITSVERIQEHYLASFDTEDNILVNDLNKQIEKAVEGLPKKCRNVFKLSRFEMKSHREIASIMGISEKTVEKHITKALHHIKANLASSFFL